MQKLDAFPTGNKDVDILFLSRIDDRDLLNALNTNKATKKYTNDENLWANRFNRLHPEDFDTVLKLKKRSWKDFSLLLIKYLDLAQGDYNKAMFLATKDGNKDLVDYFITQGANEWNEALLNAALGGHKDLVDFFISKASEFWEEGEERWEEAMFYAASYQKASTNMERVSIGMWVWFTQPKEVIEI